MFILAKSTIDPSNGDLFMRVFPQKFRSHKKAHAAMRKEYLKELEERGLEDNNAVDENGDSYSGGYIDNDEAEIYDYLDYANCQLLPVGYALTVFIPTEFLT